MLSIQSHEEHGGVDPAELKRHGLCIGSLIDFSVNSNPFGPSPCVVDALKHVGISRYPDRNCSELAGRLAELNHVSEKRILIGNGTTELIWLICHAFLRPGDRVLIIGPTFSEYHRASIRLDASVTEMSAMPPYFVPPLNKAIDFVREFHPRLVFLCNPNNPTGKYIPDEEIQDLIAVCGFESILVIDKAYSAFLDGSFFELTIPQNVLILRSMTKDFALAGLRVGYLLGDADSIEKAKAFQPTWSVNAYAQAAGLAVLSDPEYYRNSLALLKRIQVSFFDEIRSIGYHLIASDVHFALVHCGRPANLFRSQLLRSGLQVRDCTSFGLPHYIRICTRLQEENKKLIMAMKAIETIDPGRNDVQANLPRKDATDDDTSSDPTL